MRIVCVVVIAACALGVSGCGQKAEGESTAKGEEKPASDRGGVAVVDLDEVAKRLGKQAEMDDLLKRRRMELSQHLATVQASYEKQVETKTKEFGEKPNAEQVRTLNAIKQTVAIRYGREQQKAAIDLQQYRVELIRKLRAQVAPIAETIARKRGFDVVVPKDQSLLLALNPSADVTEKVIELLMKEKPKPLAAAKTAPQPAEMPKRGR